MPSLMATRYTLGTGERLKREADIEALFRTGKALSVFPVRLIWRLVPRGDEAFAIRAGFSAPKRKFKRATDRNSMKRLLREAWRLQRSELVAFVPSGQQLHAFLLSTDVALSDWGTIYTAVGESISQLRIVLSKPHA